MRLRQVLRHIGQAETGQRRMEHLRSAVEDELAFDLEKILPALNAARAYLLLTTLTNSSYE